MKHLNTVDIVDPRITEMDPVQKLWMYENWIADQIDEAEFAKNQVYLAASFTNPEAVKRALGDNVTKSSDEEFDLTSEMIRRQGQNKKKRKKRIKV